MEIEIKKGELKMVIYCLYRLLHDSEKEKNDPEYFEHVKEIANLIEKLNKQLYTNDR